MKQIMGIICCFCIGVNLLADASPDSTCGWKKQLVSGLNLTQINLNNWSQGGENTWTWMLDINGQLSRTAPKFDWTTGLKIAYGKSKAGDDRAKKAADEIRIESVWTYKLAGKINPYASGTAQSQFTKGYDYGTDDPAAVSGPLDPAYFMESIGLNYKPNESLQSRLGLAFKQTITSDYPIPYADDPETAKVEKTRTEAGAVMVTDLNARLAENIVLTSKLELFSNLEALNTTDVYWDNLFSSKISKWISVGFNFRLVYDRDVSTKRQIRQMLTAGILYTIL